MGKVVSKLEKLEAGKRNNFEKLEEKIFEDIQKLATQCHKGEYRKTGTPYIEHPKNIYKILQNVYRAEGKENYILYSAAMLHDVIENKMQNKESGIIFDLIADFGAEIVGIIAKHTKNYCDSSDEKRKAKKFFNYTLNLIYKLTKKPGITYFDYLHDIFYGKDSVGEINEKLSQNLDRRFSEGHPSFQICNTTIEVFSDFLQYKFSNRDKTIITMYSIELKLVDMYDNICSLPTNRFNVQTALYSFYKGILVSNEIKQKINRLTRERKYYQRAEKIANMLSEKIENSLQEWINYVEISLKQQGKQQEIENNYQMAEEYKQLGGFKKLTKPNKNNYFDGTIERYGKILIGLAKKEMLGFEEKIEKTDINSIAHRDLIGFKNFMDEVKQNNLYSRFSISNISKMFNLKK